MEPYDFKDWHCKECKERLFTNAYEHNEKEERINRILRARLLEQSMAKIKDSEKYLKHLSAPNLKLEDKIVVEH